MLRIVNREIARRITLPESGLKSCAWLVAEVNMLSIGPPISEQQAFPTGDRRASGGRDARSSVPPVASAVDVAQAAAGRLHNLRRRSVARPSP
jgi:hypothetical protein